MNRLLVTAAVLAITLLATAAPVGAVAPTAGEAIVNIHQGVLGEGTSLVANLFPVPQINSAQQFSASIPSPPILGKASGSLTGVLFGDVPLFNDACTGSYTVTTVDVPFVTTISVIQVTAQCSPAPLNVPNPPPFDRPLTLTFGGVDVALLHGLAPAAFQVGELLSFNGPFTEQQ